MRVLWGSVGVLFTSAAYAATVIVSSDTGEIGRLDTTTGLISDVVATGEFWLDIATTTDGMLFGVNGDGLYAIDLSAPDPITEVGPNLFLNGLAFDNNDTLFASFRDELYTIDTSTGAASLVGSISNGFYSSGDIAFGDDGMLYGTSTQGCASSASDCLFAIDAQTAEGTYIGDIGYPFVYGLASSDGSLFGVTDADGLVEIDTSTGQGTEITSDFAMDGVTSGAAGVDAPQDPETPLVPLPASGWMLLGGLALAGVGLRRSARRNG